MKLHLQSTANHQNVPSHPISSAHLLVHPSLCTHLSGCAGRGGVSVPRKEGCGKGGRPLHPSGVGLQHSTGSHHCHAPLVYTSASEINWKSHQIFLNNHANRLQISRELLLQHCQISPLLILCTAIAQHFGVGL